jgi:hypothetical protein
MSENSQLEGSVPPRYGVEIYVSDAGYVCLRQDRGYGTGEEPIILHVEEVPAAMALLERMYQAALDYVPPQDGE